MNLLSSLLAYTARQIEALRAKNVSQDSVVSGINTRVGTAESNITSLTTQFTNNISANSNSKEVLWTGNTLDGTMTLSKAISNFDFIDIEYYQIGSGSIDDNTITKRIPATAGTYVINDFALDYGNTDVAFYEQKLTLSSTSLVAAQNYEVSGGVGGWLKQTGVYQFGIKRILGIKMGSASPAELTDVRVGADNTTYASAGTAVRNQLTNLSDIVAKASAGNEMFNVSDFAVGRFENGYISPSQSSYWSTTRRVTTPNTLIYDRDIVITVNSGFRFGVGKVVDGSLVDSGWQTGSYKVPANTEFYVTIGRIPEASSDPTVANSGGVGYFVKQLHITSEIVQVLVPEQYKQFEASDFRNGVYENGQITAWNARICTTVTYPVEAGDEFVYSTGDLQIAYGVLSKEDPTTDAFYKTWHTVDEETTFEIADDGYLFVQFKKVDGSNVSPSEYDATCKLYYGVVYSATKVKKTLVAYDLDAIYTALGMTAKTYAWVQGGLAPAGETTDDKRIRMASRELMPDYVTVKPAAGYQALIYTYAGDGSVIIAGNWTRTAFTTARGDATYFRVVLAKQNTTVIVPSESTNVTITFSYDDVPSEVTELSQKIQKNYGVTYFGLPAFQKQGYNASRILSISYSGGTLNSIAVYENYIVAIINELNLIRIYNKTTKELLHEIEINLGHANNVGLGSKYDESDLLPLLYVEKEDSYGTYNVVRIDSEANASIIKVYTFPEETFGHYPQVTWNFEDGVCYSLGYNGSSVQTSNASIFVRANLNDEIANEDGSYTPRPLFTCQSQKMLFIQDCKYYNGMIYMAQSSETTGSAVSYIFLIDTSSGNIVTKIPAPFTGEIEGMAVYEEDGEVKMCATNYYHFYEMVFG